VVNGRPRKAIDDHERLGLKVDPLQALVQGDGRRGWLGSYSQHPFGASFGLGTLRIDDASVHLKYNFAPALVVD